MLGPERKRDKPSLVCHAFPAMSTTSPTPTTISIHARFEGRGYSRSATRLHDGGIATLTTCDGNHHPTLPAPVALVFAQWESYAIQRLAGSDCQCLPELLKATAGVSLASYHEEH